MVQDAGIIVDDRRPIRRHVFRSSPNLLGFSKPQDSSAESGRQRYSWQWEASPSIPYCRRSKYASPPYTIMVRHAPHPLSWLILRRPYLRWHGYGCSTDLFIRFRRGRGGTEHASCEAAADASALQEAYRPDWRIGSDKAARCAHG